MTYVDEHGLALIRSITVKTNNEVLETKHPLGMIYTSNRDPTYTLSQTNATHHNDLHAVTGSQRTGVTVIPFDFSWSKHLHNALPLGETRGSPLYVETGSFNSICTVISDNDDDAYVIEPAQANRPMSAPELNMWIQADYYIVHKCERNVRQGKDFDYLWQVDRIYQENTVTLRNPVNKFTLRFSPTNIVMWMGIVTQARFLADGRDSMSKDYFNFGGTGECGESIQSVKLSAGSIVLADTTGHYLTKGAYLKTGKRELPDRNGLAIFLDSSIDPNSAAPAGSFYTGIMDALTLEVVIAGASPTCPTENDVVILTRGYAVMTRSGDMLYILQGD